MSLKAFHVFFIVVSMALCVGLGVWATQDFARSGSGVHLALGVGSFTVATTIATEMASAVDWAC